MRLTILLLTFSAFVSTAFGSSFGEENTAGDSTSIGILSVQNPVPNSENPITLIQRDGRLQIRFTAEINTGMVYLFDLLGNKIHESNANDNIDWSLANLKSGVYFVVWKENKTSFTRKFIHKQDN